jgi:lipid-A-disaccharide synthase
MRLQGVDLIAELDELTVMGLVEVLPRLPYFWRLERRIHRLMDGERPDLVVLIDFPGFNMRIARAAHERGCAVLYYIAPKAWAWRRERAHALAETTDRVAVILPFEADFLRDFGVDATYVGHPLLDRPDDVKSRATFSTEWGLDPARPLLAMLPGSRTQELGRHIEPFTRIAERVVRARPDVLPVFSRAEAMHAGPFHETGFPAVADTRALLRHASAALVKSGTSTLEAVIEGTPMAVAYRASSLTVRLARRLIQVEHFALPNLVAGERVVPEFLQEQVEPDAVGAISRAAQGSFRDALGTLDQLVAYGGDVLATDDVLAVLGIADADLIFGAAEAIATQDGRAAIETVDALSRSGRDPVRFARDVIAHLRQLLVVRSTEEVPESFGLVAAHSARLAEQAGRLGEVALVRAIDALSAALAGIREGDDARMALELALLRSARPEIDPSRDALAQRLERIERTLGQAGLAAPGPAGEITIEREQAETDPGPSEAGAEPDGQPDAAASHTGGTGTSVQDEAPGGVGAQPDGGSGQEVESAVGNAPAVAAAVAERPGPKTGAVGTAESQSESTESGERASDAAASVPADLDQIVALWPAVAEQLRESGSELLSTVVEAARPVSLDAESGVLEVGFPPSAQFNKRKVEMKANRELFTDALRAVAGLTLRPTFVLLEEEHSSSESENGDGPLSEEEEQALIAQVKSAFDAEEYEPDEQGTDAASSDGDATSAAVDAAAPEGDATASDADTAAPEGGAASSDAEGAR